MESEMGPDAENVRVEYTALASYSNAVVGFRFTIIGFYLAAVGLIAGHGGQRSDGLLLFGITLALWLVEVRNRSLLATLGARAVQIEREIWGYTGSRVFDGFASRQLKMPVLGGPDPPPRDPGVVWHLRLPFTVSHSLGIDLLFTTIGAYSVFVSIHG